jgi:adenosyl cobinamide kinase/adenosyl cobinamide phosphate guanylyltransferase
MSALRMSTTADIITVMANDGDWQAMIVEHSEIFERTEKWAKTKEAALEDLLKKLSFDLFIEFQLYLV